MACYCKVMVKTVISWFDQLHVPLHCESLKCGKRTEIILSRLVGKTSFPCEFCGATIKLNVEPYAWLVEKMVDTASELDKQARQRGELVKRL